MKNDNINFSNYNITETSFNFVQDENRFADAKLKTKTTTFAKDSFRRFCKNKSSVVGAIVLGILVLLTIFVPIFSQVDVDRVSSQEAYLQPKLFNAGTGFWDGTKSYEKTYNADGTINGILYDTVNQTPSGFVKSAVMNCVVDEEPTLINKTNVCGIGGYFKFLNKQKADSTGKLLNVTLTSSAFSMAATGDYSLSIEFGNDDGVENGTLGNYRVYVACGEDNYVLRDWSNDYSKLDVNLRDHISGAITDAKLVFELAPMAGIDTYVLIKSCVFATSVEADKENLATVGFADANAMASLAIDSAGKVPAGYWVSTGTKTVYAVQVYYCEFTYDTYEVAFGMQRQTIAVSDFQEWIDKGWCSYDFDIGPESFVRLSDDCPIDKVVKQENYDLGSYQMPLSVIVDTPKYITLGYDHMPRFILGTDANGVDLFTRMFTGLRTSLVLGVCTAAFCFVFGLIWGSISGYFGGAVDLAMERFCDILGGVPWIVVMTLCILHLGNNFLTFFLALCMTGWMGTAARTRTQFYRFKGSEYVLASRTLGSSDIRLIFKHILPNSLGTIVTSSVLMITSSIYSESTLAYLNLGLQGVQAFGVMLSENQKYISSNPYLIIFPSIVMALMMISFNLFGNGLRDALNPVLRGAED